MKFARPLTALALVALLTVTGCSSDGDGDGDAGQTGSAQPSESAAPSDGQGAPAAPEADVEDVPDVVAEVNGEEISREDFIANYQSQLQQAAMSTDPSQIDQDQLKVQVAETMVDHALLVQAAADSGIEPTEADIDATLEDVAAQSGLGSVDEVVAALEEQGMTEDDVRAEAADQFRVLGYIEAEADLTEPTEAELREQYDAYAEQMSASGQDGELPAFEDVRDQLAQQAVSQQQNAAAEEILTTLRDEGDVTINL